MQFKTATVAILAAFFAAGECAPTARANAEVVEAAAPASDEPIFWQRPYDIISPNPEAGVLAKRSNQCGASTFENRGSGASPFVSDCEQIIRNLSGSGTWALNFQPHYEIAKYGSCRFGIEWGQLHRGTVLVGTDDVKDLIRDSINKFRRGDGRVGSRGIMPCGPQELAVVWGLY
ncbi:RF2-like protein [Triangularia setosa]|uniref:RF2-like protein n=1 Tax=Triangularia setosa TaxID=2587417 RepID=A0AAN6WCJ0_9PEZI|nr:RF2-like protein [Podospora setosa]